MGKKENHTEMSRREKGRHLAQAHADSVTKTKRGWEVIGSRPEPYVVSLESGFCSCPDKQNRGADDPLHRCKHWWAAWYRAPLSVEFQVRNLPADEWGNERWGVAMRRGGVLIEVFGAYPSSSLAYKAKEVMAGEGTKGSVAVA